jgi:uncharacterized protein YwgA
MESVPSIKVENGTDMILTLLFAGGVKKSQNEEIVGNTRLVKLIFILEQETNLKKYLTDFNYDAYNYGPYSSELFDALQALINAGLVKAGMSESEGFLDEADRYQVEIEAAENADSPKSTMVYSLTGDGMKVATALYNSLSANEQSELNEIKSRFNSISLRQLLQYVYRKYPKFTTASVIKDYVY